LTIEKKFNEETNKKIKKRAYKTGTLRERELSFVI